MVSALSASTALAADAPAGTVVITPADVESGLLEFRDTRSLGHNEFLVDGLRVWTEDTSSQSKAAGYLDHVEPLADIASGEEPTLDWSPDAGFTAIPGKQLVVDFDGTDGPDGILVGEPVYGANWWLNNAAEPFVKAGAPHTGGGSGSPWFGTLDEWSTAFPDAETFEVGYSMGSGVHGSGVIDAMTYGETTYEFALGLGSCAAEVDEATSTYRLLDDCSTTATINVGNGWTVDGDGHTLTAVENAQSPNFPGPVLLSATGVDGAPASMNVKDLVLDTEFSGGNSGGQLAGIRFNRAGGSISNVDITGITHGNGVQEGHALFVRNRAADGSIPADEVTVTIDDVNVTRYQKTGIILDGNVEFAVTDTVVGEATDQAGNPLGDVIAANSMQISRAAHGTITGSTIALNDYTASDDWTSTGVLVYNAGEVTLSQSIVTGASGDIGLDAYNDGTSGDVDTVVNISCTLFQRETADPGDAWSIGLSQSDPAVVNLADSTFLGWNTDTASWDAEGELVPGPENQQTGVCKPTAPEVTVTVDDDEADVTWTAATAPAYAPIQGGYTVTLSGDDGSSQTLEVDGGTTTAHFEDLEDGVTYTVEVSVSNASGTASGSATLYATTLTLEADKPTVVYKSATTVRGQITTTDPDADLSGREVTIQARPNGASKWTDVETVETDAAGEFSLQVKPKKHTSYRAQYVGGSDMPSTSNPATIYVEAKVSLTVSDTTVPVGTDVLFVGKVQPKLKGETVTLERLVGGSWQAQQTYQLKKNSQYKFFWEADAPGSSQWRVTVPETQHLLKGISKKITIVVS